ncbi:MAG: DNA methylase [Clostridia bacterium]|nr:DNA methylase [Clostridia bacterium]
MEQKKYIAIDLKSFYASVECADRGLDPLTTNLVVADKSRTEKTICLAVSPSLKAYKIPGRARLFEVVQRVKEVNAQRKFKAPGEKLTDYTYDAKKLAYNSALGVDYIVAVPRMARYMEVSTKIFDIYMRYVAPEDIHVYSVDEVFIDATSYLRMHGLTAREFAMILINAVLGETGITATAGIGTNLYLAKIAMDIMAKRIPADKNGVRIAELDENSYRAEMWNHRPLTDFWRIGKGYAKKLEQNGLYTMGDIARCSVGKKGERYSEDLLYKLFGINAELLIDHAWGWEPCTIADIKAYKPENNSLSSGQVLKEPYPYEKAKLVIKEMTDLLVLDLVEKGLVCDQMVLTVCYDTENTAKFGGEITTDYYGRQVPKSAHGSVNLGTMTSSGKKIITAVSELYDKIVDKNLTVRRMYVVANHVITELEAKNQPADTQMSFFTDYSEQEKRNAQEQAELEREKRMQKAVISIKKKYGKNAVLRGMNYEEGATAIERNGQVGGHKA